MDHRRFASKVTCAISRWQTISCGQQRESSRGKTFFFAHDGHVLASLRHYRSPILPDWNGAYRSTGMYLRSALGRDMVVMGSWFGHGAGLPAWMLPQDT
jgi:hypothetical protein